MRLPRATLLFLSGTFLILSDSHKVKEMYFDTFAQYRSVAILTIARESVRLSKVCLTSVRFISTKVGTKVDSVFLV